MQGTYTHIPETNYVPREHGVAAILLFLFMVLISLLAVLLLLLLLLLLSSSLTSFLSKTADSTHYINFVGYNLTFSHRRQFCGMILSIILYIKR